MHAKKLNLKEKCKKIKKVVTAVTLMGAIVVSQPGLVQAAASLTGANSTSGTMGNYKVGGNVSLRAHVASATTYVDNSGTGNLYVKLRYEYANNGTIYYINGEKNTATAVGIDAQGGLIIKKNDGSTDVLRSGEISLRLSE